MTFSETYRFLLQKRLETNDEILTYNEPFIKDTIHLFSRNIPEAIDFFNNDCTADEYIWISELIEDIASESRSVSLIRNYALLSNKYPQETKDYNILSFINSTMAIAESWQEDED